MGFILFSLFCVLFAGSIVELNPTSATPTLSCGALSAKGTPVGTTCSNTPGCAWNATVTTCVADPCLKLSTNTDQAQWPSPVVDLITCDVPATNFSWAHTTNCNANDYVKKDTYSHASTSIALNKCSFTYLANSSAPAPYCQLKPIDTAVPDGSNVNVGTPVVGCETDNNGQLTNLCACLGAWDIINSDTTNANCLSYPKCYVSATGTCVKDTCVDQATCAAGCSAVEVYKPVINGLTISGSELKPICTNSELNKTPNKCFDLIYLNETTVQPYCLNGLTANKAQCDAVEECTTVTNAALYNSYFRTEYFCTDKEHAAPGGAGFLIRVPSILVLLLIAFSFLF